MPRDYQRLQFRCLWTELISSIKKQLLTNWTASHLVGIITLDYFWIDGYLWCKFTCNLQSIASMGNGVTWGTATVEMHLSVMCFAEKYFQLVFHPLHLSVLQTTKGKCRHAILEGLKTKHTFNVIHVEFFCAWFPAVI